MRRLLLLAMLLSFFVGSAQTLQRSEDANPRKTDSTKYTTQIKAIVDSYDQAALADLFVVNDAKERAEKQDALAYALVKNIPEPASVVASERSLFQSWVKAVACQAIPLEEASG